MAYLDGGDIKGSFYNIGPLSGCRKYLSAYIFILHLEKCSRFDSLTQLNPEKVPSSFLIVAAYNKQMLYFL